MTRKDYEKFAEMFKNYRPEAGDIQPPADMPGVYVCPEVLRLAHQTADIFGQDNERFDRERYLQACGVRPEDMEF